MSCALVPLLGAATFLLAVGSTACGRAPTHRIESLRFSDSDVRSGDHPDTYDTTFELAHAPNIHAHLHVTGASGSRTNTVSVTCLLHAPNYKVPHRIVATREVPSDQREFDWPLKFDAAAPVQWIAGKYSVSCESPSNTVTGHFEVVTPNVAKQNEESPKQYDFADALRRFRQYGGAAPMWSREGMIPAPLLPPSPPITHQHPPDPEATSPAPSPAHTFTPRFSALSDRYSESEYNANQFDAATTRYIGYSVFVRGAKSWTTGWDGCVLTRADTGVSYPVAYEKISLGSDGVLLGGVIGADVPGYWIPGVYDLVCEPYRGASFDPVSFTVSGFAPTSIQDHDVHVGPKVDDGAGGHVEVKSVGTFAFDGADFPDENRRQFFRMFVGRPRSVGAAVTYQFKPRSETWTLPFRCHFFTTGGRLIAALPYEARIPADASDRILMAWSAGPGGVWNPGTYLIECDAYGVFSTLIAFVVENRAALK